jgi:hypothetical protein
VARRVRHLRIDPHFDQDFIPTEDRKGRDSFWRRGIGRVMKRVREQQPPTEVWKYAGLEGLEQALIDALSCLSNVTVFTADWWTLPPEKHLQSFLPAAWSAFGSNLQELSLGGNLESIRTLAATATRLRVLQKLRLEFTNDILRRGDQGEKATLVDVIAPFINELSLTLKNLTIVSWSTIDLSSFFLRLGFFPLLQQFEIRVPFNKALSADPSGFTRFLRDHSPTLAYVALRLNPSGSVVDPSEEESLGEWMTMTSSDDIILTNLQSFQMYPTMLLSGFQALLAYLARSADTLTALSVRDRYLSYNEADAIISTFLHRPASSRLTSLRLNMRALSPRLIDLFAAKLPELHTLSLYVGEAWRDENGGYIDNSSPVNNFAPFPVMHRHLHFTQEELRNGLRKRIYPDWKLYNIGIWQNGAEMDDDLMDLLARCIPSLRSFWSQGNLSLVAV